MTASPEGSALVPTVTVGIPTRNRPELLREAVASVVSQDYQYWKLLIWDNGGLEANRAVSESFRDPRIHYVAEHTRAGIAANFNYVLDNCDTQYCAILHDDDLYHPQYLRRMLEAMDECDAEWAFCDAEWSDLGPAPVDGAQWPVQDADAVRIAPGPRSALGIFAGDLIVPCPSAMYRTEVARRERFDERYPMACDLDFFVRLANKRPGMHLPVRLLRYRGGPHTASQSATRSGQYLIDEVSIGRALKSAASLEAVRPELVAAHRRRVRNASGTLLMAPGLGPSAREYAQVRDVLKGENGVLPWATRLIVGHRLLMRLMVISQGRMRFARRFFRSHFKVGRRI